MPKLKGKETLNIKMEKFYNFYNFKYLKYKGDFKCISF